MPDADTAKYIVTELKMPEEKKRIDAEYSKFARRILWLDDEVSDGAFHMNTAWYLKAAETMEAGPTSTRPTRSSASSGTTPTIPGIWEARSRSGWRTTSTSSPRARSSSCPPG